MNSTMNGIAVDIDLIKVYPKDGLKFMKQLSTHFSGSRVRATDVMEIED